MYIENAICLLCYYLSWSFAFSQQITFLARVMLSILHSWQIPLWWSAILDLYYFFYIDTTLKRCWVYYQVLNSSNGFQNRVRGSKTISLVNWVVTYSRTWRFLFSTYGVKDVYASISMVLLMFLTNRWDDLFVECWKANIDKLKAAYGPQHMWKTHSLKLIITCHQKRRLNNSWALFFNFRMHVCFGIFLF